MKTLFSIFGFYFLFILSGCRLSPPKVENCKLFHDSETNRDYYTKTDILPDYLGGLQKATEFIVSSFKAPQKKYEINQKVWFEYLIEKDGRPSLLRLIELNNDKEVEQEIKRILGIMPSFTPAKCGTDNVSTKVTLSFPLHSGQ